MAGFDPGNVNLEKLFPQGEIEFLNVKTKYREKQNYVLKGVSFKISSHEKIGVVGRTGAGKSTILLTLFRILDLNED